MIAERGTTPGQRRRKRNLRCPQGINPNMKNGLLNSTNWGGRGGEKGQTDVQGKSENLSRTARGSLSWTKKAENRDSDMQRNKRKVAMKENANGAQSRGKHWRPQKIYL